MKIVGIITGDLVKSRKIGNEDVEPVIGSLKQCFSEINELLLQGQAKYDIFRGDRFQYSVPEPQKALLVNILIRTKLLN